MEIFSCLDTKTKNEIKTKTINGKDLFKKLDEKCELNFYSEIINYELDKIIKLDSSSIAISYRRFKNFRPCYGIKIASIKDKKIKVVSDYHDYYENKNTLKTMDKKGINEITLVFNNVIKILKYTEEKDEIIEKFSIKFETFLEKNDTINDLRFNDNLCLYKVLSKNRILYNNNCILKIYQIDFEKKKLECIFQNHEFSCSKLGENCDETGSISDIIEIEDKNLLVFLLTYTEYISPYNGGGYYPYREIFIVVIMNIKNYQITSILDGFKSMGKRFFYFGGKDLFILEDESMSFQRIYKLNNFYAFNGEKEYFVVKDDRRSRDFFFRIDGIIPSLKKNYYYIYGRRIESEKWERLNFLNDNNKKIKDERIFNIINLGNGKLLFIHSGIIEVYEMMEDFIDENEDEKNKD